jgi:uncharacterized protein (TIGR00369 family)
MTNVEFADLCAAIRRELESQEFMRLVGAEVVDVALGEVTLALDRRAQVLQHAGGLFHGGVIAFLVDNATTAAAATHIDHRRQTCLTAEYKLSFLAPAKGDRLVCKARVLKPGRLLSFVEAKVDCRTGSADRPTAVALATVAIVDLPKNP